MSLPVHYHVWVRSWNGRALTMLGAQLTKEGIKRERRRESQRTVRRWWRSRQSARYALAQDGRPGHVLKCDDPDCPEAEHVRAN